MIVEIGYSYQLDKTSPTQTSWTYFHVKDGPEDKAKTKAKSYFKKWLLELGWTKQAKVTHIEIITNEKTYFPDYVIVSKSELSSTRKRTSTPSEPQKKPPRSNTRGISRKA